MKVGATSYGHNWARTLNETQRAAVQRVMHENGVLGSAKREGWTVFMIPTTGKARYLELRHYLIDGQVARWVIEQDGMVSAHNDRGLLRELVPA